MRKSLANAAGRKEVLQRLKQLRPEAKPLWGRMTAPQMLAHVSDWMLMASGDLPVAEKRVVLRYPPIKQLAIYWLPFPKGLPTARELLTRTPYEWGAECESMRARVEAFEKLYQKSEWPHHPVFGRLSGQSWGVLGYRHTDHHFRQFGV